MSAFLREILELIRRFGRVLRRVLRPKPPPLPNLSIESFTGDSRGIYVNEPFQLETKILNTGKSASGGTVVQVESRDNGSGHVTGVVTAPVGIIQPGDHVRVKFQHPGLPTLATYILRATIDPQQAVVESFEGDNSITLTVYVQRRP